MYVFDKSNSFRFYIISFFAIIIFSVLFFTPLKSYAGTSSFSYTEYGSTTDVTYSWSFSSDNALRVCAYHQSDNSFPYYFVVSTDYGIDGSATYDLTITTYTHSSGNYSTQTQSGSLISVSSRYNTTYENESAYYYRLGYSFYPSSGYEEQSVASISCPIFLNNSTALWDYLFNPSSVFPDFSDYEYAGYLSATYIGYPYGYQLDAGVSWWSYLKMYSFGDLISYCDQLLIQYIGVQDEIFFNPTLTPSAVGYEFTDDRSISSLVRPDSMFYVVVTPLDTVNKLYGDTQVYEYQIGESYVGKLIRSFGNNGTNNYYSNTLNVNGSDKDIVNIVSVPSYTTNTVPSQYGYDYYYNSNPTYNDTYYYPTFDDSRNFTQQDIDYIINHYVNNNTNNINQNVKNNFDFDLDLNDVSSGDIQKMYDDTTDMFTLIADIFGVVAALFGMCFPFLLFDIPGWLIFFGGLLIVGAGVGIFIKIVKFLRG